LVQLHPRTFRDVDADLRGRRASLAVAEERGDQDASFLEPLREVRLSHSSRISELQKQVYSLSEKEEGIDGWITVVSIKKARANVSFTRSVRQCRRQIEFARVMAARGEKGKEKKQEDEQEEHPEWSDEVYDRIDSILEKHGYLNFVQRILNPLLWQIYVPNEYEKKRWKFGDYGTHLMTESKYKGDDPKLKGKWIAYPLIQWFEPNQALELFDPDVAYYLALHKKEFIAFDTKEEAEFFGRNYKIMWDDPKEVVWDYFEKIYREKTTKT